MRAFLTVLALVFPLQAFSAEPPADPAAWLKPFKLQLKQALQQGLAQGPAAAIDVCRVEAPAIAKQVAPEGVQMGRSSHRLRNPDNAPADWLAPVIDAYLEASKPAPRQLDLADGRKAWVEPIMTGGMCLACHGNNLSEAVQQALSQHYPNDQATGFSAGDLRGVFWVTWQPGKQAAAD